MLYQIYATTIKDLKILLRDKGGMVTLFLMPIVFILVMTTALGGAFGGGGDARPVNLLVVNQDSGALARQVLEGLREVESLALVEQWDGVALTRERADELIRGEPGYPVALIFPADFSARVGDVQPGAAEAVVSFIVDPAMSDQVLAPLQGAVQALVARTAAVARAPLQARASFEALARAAPPEQAQLIAQLAQGFIERMSAQAAQGSGVRFEQSLPSGMRISQRPSAEEQNVPGYAIFGVFMIVAMLASNILRERQEGSFRRLMAAPISRASLLVGKLLPYYLVNIVQVALMFAVGMAVFGMSLGSSPLALLLVTLATGLAACGLALLISTFGKSQEQIGGVSSLLLITMAAIGGMFVPTFVMPDFMQTLARVTPHSWALSGYHDVIVRGQGVGAVLGEVGVLLAFAAALFSLALWRFRFD